MSREAGTRGARRGRVLGTQPGQTLAVSPGLHQPHPLLSHRGFSAWPWKACCCLQSPPAALNTTTAQTGKLRLGGVKRQPGEGDIHYRVHWFITQRQIHRTSAPLSLTY